LTITIKIFSDILFAGGFLIQPERDNGHHMVSTINSQQSKYAESEIGTIRKSWRGKIRIALAYPNYYPIGMSNLGFQSLYRLLNAFDQVVCERVFLPDGRPGTEIQLRTFESGRPLAHADILAFSLSFENDFPHILSILEMAKLALRTSDRGDGDPLIIAGGVACFLNPEPIAEFIDCFLIGEAEVLLPQFLNVFETGQPKHAILKRLAQNVTGAYVPGFYEAQYKRQGAIETFAPTEDVPPKIKRVSLKNLDEVSTHSAVITPHTTFDETFLIEVGRGCPHGCRFCAAGFIYRPVRFRPIELIEKSIADGAMITSTIGLVGAAVSDLPGIQSLCGRLTDARLRISFSSLRADRLSAGLLAVLKQSKVKTATIAPEAGSARLRAVINKGITEKDVLEAAAALVENGIPNLKLYFMVGLPTETEADVDGIITLCKRIKHHFLKSSRARKRIGEITISLNSFVPKPFTPFQWAAMDETAALKKKAKRLKRELNRVANMRVHADVPRWAYIQALFSRGDRRVADMLILAHQNRGNWAQTLKAVPLNPDFYVHRERNQDEIFPWDFIDHGIKKSFLWREFQKAKQGKPTSPLDIA